MEQRLSVLGRLRMADWIEMPERQFALEIKKVEKDPLFQKLYFGEGSLPSAIRRRRWPNSKLSGSFYDVDEGRVSSTERVGVEEQLDAHDSVTELIRRMGRPAFESYFLNADEVISMDEIGKRTGLSPSEIAHVHDLLLDIGAQAEFSGAPKAAPAARGTTCLAQMTLSDGRFGLEIVIPHLIQAPRPVG
jgi:hypothetical protein